MTLNDASERFFRKEHVNLNTIVAIVGFLGMFAGFVATWSSIQYKQEASDRWQEDHMSLHSRREANEAAQFSSIYTRLDEHQKQFNQLEEFKFRVAQLEKGSDGIDNRINRVTESYSNQFTEVRTLLATLTTQIALANDALSRMEKQQARENNP